MAFRVGERCITCGSNHGRRPRQPKFAAPVTLCLKKIKVIVMVSWLCGRPCTKMFTVDGRDACMINFFVARGHRVVRTLPVLWKVRSEPQLVINDSWWMLDLFRLNFMIYLHLFNGKHVVLVLPDLDEMILVWRAGDKPSHVFLFPATKPASNHCLITDANVRFKCRLRTW